jgi:hypothetical protein
LLVFLTHFGTLPDSVVTCIYPGPDHKLQLTQA